MRRNKKCCIDSCVWVKYAGHNRIAVLLKYIHDNGLVVFADRYLLGEVHKTLITEFNFSIQEANRVTFLIESFVFIVVPRSICRMCNDSTDNFLYDICIQNNCQLLITVDKTLLIDPIAPFTRKTDAWLRKRK